MAVSATDPLPEAAGQRPGRSRRPDTKVIVLIDHEAVKRGWVEGDERCEIAGVGPVSVDTARSLMADCFGAAIVTDGTDVFTAVHLGRSVTELQRTALEARGYRCEVPGCGATRGLEIDHIEDWSRTFRTELALLAWLCRAHHRDKTHRGWCLSGPPGDRRWLGPENTAAGHSPPGASASEPRPRRRPPAENTPEPGGDRDLDRWSRAVAQEGEPGPDHPPPKLFGDPSVALT